MILHDVGVIYGGQSWPICAPMILLLWFCSYDFAPMILTKQGLPDPYSSLMWCPPEPCLSTIAVMHPTSIVDASIWHWNGIKRVKHPICALLFCSYDFAPMILLLSFWQNKGYLTLFEPHVRSTWAILECHSGYASCEHCWWFYMTLEWYKEGKAPNMCSYDFAPMILLLWFLTKSRIKPQNPNLSWNI